MTRKSLLLFALLSGTSLLMPGAAFAQGDMVTVQAMMIQAQQDSTPMDRRLERVEYKLRRVFGFPFYQYVGEGTAVLGPNAESTISLPGGHTVRIRLSGKGKAEVRWLKGGQALLSTSVGLSRNSPVVLGGVPSDGGTLILVLDQK